jgi:hypothetical protein
MFIISDISQISKDGTIINNSNTPLKVYFNICYASGSLSYLRPLDKFVKGYLQVNKDGINEIYFPTKKSLNQRQIEISSVSQINFFCGNVISTLDASKKENVSKYTLNRYLYNTLEHAKAGNISNSIGVSNTLCRNFNSSDHQKEIKFTSYNFIDSDNINKSIFATYSSTNKTNLDGSVAENEYTEAIMTYSGFDYDSKPSEIPLNTSVKLIDNLYNKVTIYKINK